jgi:hypothetical protein
MQHSRKHDAEKAVEVVRDHEDGTSSGGWFRAAEVSLFGGWREWTHSVANGGGATKLAGGRKNTNQARAWRGSFSAAAVSTLKETPKGRR